jgi:hypothetical protein
MSMENGLILSQQPSIETFLANAQTLYEAVRAPCVESGQLSAPNLEFWADGEKIHKKMCDLFQGHAHLIHPSLGSIHSPFSRNREYSEEGIVNYLISFQQCITEDGGELKKPIFAIINTVETGPLEEGSTEFNRTGGSHWFLLAIMPKDYSPPLKNEEPAETPKEVAIIIIDSYLDTRFPLALKLSLQYGCDYIADGVQHQIPPLFRNATFQAYRTSQQINNSYDCGWWVIYNAYLLFCVGDTRFIEPAYSRDPGIRLRVLLPDIAEERPQQANSNANKKNNGSKGSKSNEVKSSTPLKERRGRNRTRQKKEYKSDTEQSTSLKKNNRERPSSEKKDTKKEPSKKEGIPQKRTGASKSQNRENKKLTEFFSPIRTSQDKKTKEQETNLNDKKESPEKSVPRKHSVIIEEEEPNDKISRKNSPMQTETPLSLNKTPSPKLDINATPSNHLINELLDRLTKIEAQLNQFKSKDPKPRRQNTRFFRNKSYQSRRGGYESTQMDVENEGSRFRKPKSRRYNNRNGVIVKIYVRKTPESINHKGSKKSHQ